MAKLIVGVNDLATVRPDLVKEWDFEKNDIIPTQITSGSQKKVWWQCNKGHSWQAIVLSRTKGIGCPYCSNKRVLSGYNDLLTTNPNLAKEWNFDRNELLPTEVTYGSTKKIWWRCKRGHEWQASVNSRYNGNGCPYCSGQKILKGYNDLATLRPDLAQEWNYIKNDSLTPDKVSRCSKKKVWWKCGKGHEWKATIYNRLNGSGCPYCSGYKSIEDINDLATLRPNLAQEWNYIKNGGLTPNKISLGSGKTVWWKCNKGHEWRDSIWHRSMGRGCPYCSGKRVQKGYNDLLTVRPDLVKEWNYARNEDLTPDMVSAGSVRKVWWKCKKGHEWKAEINWRSNGSGCPYCSRNKYKDRLIYNFKTNLVIEGYYKCECQKCGYSNILTIDEMKEHYQLCNST